MQKKVQLLESFIQTYGPGGKIIYGRAPGRVNLIGEHTDYNEGFVFPMAIEFEVKIAARRRPDEQVKIYAVDYKHLVEVSWAQNLTYDPEYQGCNYPLAVLWALKSKGIQIPGVEIAFAGDIPQGAGLSSSAAIEVATALVVQSLVGFAMNPEALAQLCQTAENEFIGTKCGIMDQFVSMMGREGHALFLDCRSLAYQHIPLNLGEYAILICQSGVKHSLVASEYNVRREQCETGVEVIARCYPQVNALRDVEPEQLAACRPEMEPVVYRRCRHIVQENLRVTESVNALHRLDLRRFGQLMNASHDSLRDDFEVSCAEVDRLVELARQVPGVLGARITGGGFGGCTVNLLPVKQKERFINFVGENYRQQTGITPEFYTSFPANGAEILK